MAEASTVQEIVAGVVRDTKTWVAFIGVLGAIVGSLLTILGNFAFHWMKTHRERSIRSKRKELLKKLLEAKSWRRVSTMSKVLGTPQEETKALLIECGARGSEKRREDEEEVWGLISKHPLKDVTDSDA